MEKAAALHFPLPSFLRQQNTGYNAWITGMQTGIFLRPQGKVARRGENHNRYIGPSSDTRRWLSLLLAG